jgi:UDP-N-acetylglucosamine 2-epimerase (non-hydrolysing)
MLVQVLDFFEIKPKYELDVMQPNQELSALTAAILRGVSKIMAQHSFDLVFVQGDTTTSFAAALAAFYAGVKVCHIEAGLRTNNKQSPFPEELNRQLTTRIADYHFAPTTLARTNLLAEGISDEDILVTGNTVIDALLWTVEKLKQYSSPEIDQIKNRLHPDKKKVLVTGHRRESFGNGFKRICQALLEIANRDDVQIIYPVHLNPNVQEPVNNLLGKHPNIELIKPLSYPAFVWLMSASHAILTDSGGVQEEAPSLGKPVLVMRETTERVEAIEAGTAHLVGTDVDLIISSVILLLEQPANATQKKKDINPYGDGKASMKILNYLKL